VAVDVDRHGAQAPQGLDELFAAGHGRPRSARVVAYGRSLRWLLVST
jgi:hypothetical protein